MKMKNILKSAPVLTAMAVPLMFIFSSCDDDAPVVVDTTAPEIANVEVSEETEPGGTLVLAFSLADDIALGEVRIDIHDDFDGHEHGRISQTAKPFTYQVILDEMAGEKTYRVEEQIPIPADAATGPYHLQVRFFDAAGNEGEFYVGSFEISSETASPAIVISNFGESEELEANENGILLLEGSVTAKTEGGLEEVHILVVHEDEDHGHARVQNEEEPLYDQEWELKGAMEFNLAEIDPAIDLSAAAAGHYELIILAKDVQGNVKIITREIHVD